MALTRRARVKQISPWMETERDTTLNVRVPRELKERVKDLAEDQNKTMSDIVIDYMTMGKQL